MNTVTEWCSSCESEVELPRGNKWYTCPECNEDIAPCNQFSHGEEELKDLPLCICMGEELK